jgi:tRNA-splicing ligase RtcB
VNAVIPNAVGVDIGCGMVAVETDFPAGGLTDMKKRRAVMDAVKKLIPVGEGHSRGKEQKWEGFERYADQLDSAEKYEWPNALDRKNLGTLGGGNHFIEFQESVETFDKEYKEGRLWLMIHSGSRNLGYKIASCYHKKAVDILRKRKIEIPSEDLAFLEADTSVGRKYIRDMNFALDYARENRRRIMNAFMEAVCSVIGDVTFIREINIHHNYAAYEEHFGEKVWVHRKGAVSAKKGETGIIPGSMGTASYIVRGLGNPESFMSSSHGAGRRMGRNEASRRLTVEECDRAMEGVAFDRWSRCGGKFRRRKNKDKDLYDLSEAPLAYKNIDTVIKSELDLTEPLVRLRPLGVVKG